MEIAEVKKIDQHRSQQRNTVFCFEDYTPEEHKTLAHLGFNYLKAKIEEEKGV